MMVTVTERKSEHESSGGRGEANPCGNAAQPTATQQPDGKAYLAAGRPGHRLRESNEFPICSLSEPAAAFDELRAKVAEVCDRPAKGGAAEAEKDEQHLQRARDLSRVFIRLLPFAFGHSPSMKRFASQEILLPPMQRMAIRPMSMQKSTRPSCIAGQNP